MKFFWYSVILFILGYLVTLGCRPMTMPDEFRHAEIVREMRAQSAPFSPRLLTVRYFEKPILCHHCNLAPVRCFAANAFGMRLPAALFTGLTGAMIAATVWQRRRDAKLAALAFGFYMSFALVYGIATMPITDAPVTFFTTAAILSAFLASLEAPWGRRRIFLEILCAFSLAGGFYTKGAVGLAVPGVSIFCFLVWEKRWREFYRLPLIVLPVLLAVVLPLAWKIHRAEPDFWNYFINVEHIQRFTQNAPGQHPQPWWYFLPVICIGTLPGITFLPCLFGWGGRFRCPLAP
ncbi:MAG: phospholipid carrier-dependent glycosyltransferase, partial [Victivallaceae bacterium]|nr:phospholipid carrier-dependent glycosyltransferase [Victivallaceae bacterium]